MNDNRTNIQTGIFVSIGLILLLASILFFGGDRAFLKSYKLFIAKFNSTQGLDIGSQVSLSGMRVGNIKSISFDTNGALVTTLQIEAKFLPLITNQVVASIRTQGALGDKYIYLNPGVNAGTALEENSEIVANNQPDLLDMISEKSTDLNSLTSILKELDQLLHNLNSDGKSALLIKNVVESSQSLTRVMSDPNIKESFLHLKSIMYKIDHGDGTLGQLVNNSSLHDRLLSLMGDSPRNQYLKPLLREAIKQNEKK
jgi:phospholipid/cholesterol/gamma-HCH transport system substrate-binding protein